MEGVQLGIKQAKDISLLSIENTPFFPDKNFAFGSLEINYKENEASGTLYELSDINEPDSDLSSIYSFNYLYDTK